MKTTKLTIRDDYPTALATTPNANINCFGFNHEYITARDPLLAVEILELYHRARMTIDKKPIDKNSLIWQKADLKLKLFKDKYELD
jgi:hypothetical protein